MYRIVNVNSGYATQYMTYITHVPFVGQCFVIIADLQHFIWVFAVRKYIPLGVPGLQRVNCLRNC